MLLHVIKLGTQVKLSAIIEYWAYRSRATSRQLQKKNQWRQFWNVLIFFQRCCFWLLLHVMNTKFRLLKYTSFYKHTYVKWEPPSLKLIPFKDIPIWYIHTYVVTNFWVLTEKTHCDLFFLLDIRYVTWYFPQKLLHITLWNIIHYS